MANEKLSKLEAELYATQQKLKPQKMTRSIIPDKCSSLPEVSEK